MPGLSEATDTDLKVIERLKQIGWKLGDVLLYQQEQAVSPKHKNKKMQIIWKLIN